MFSLSFLALFGNSCIHRVYFGAPFLALLNINFIYLSKNIYFRGTMFFKVFLSLPHAYSGYVCPIVILVRSISQESNIGVV